MDLVEVYKIMNGISDVDRDKLSTVSNYTETRGHSMKFAKRQHRLKVRSNSLSIRVIDSWNSLPESVIMAPFLNCSKSRSSTPPTLIPGATSPDQHQSDTRIKACTKKSLGHL